MLTHLPMESALRTEERDALPEGELAKIADQRASHGPWSKVEYLLAEVKDAVEQLTYIQMRMNTPQSTTVPMPKPRPRPGVASAQSKTDPRAIAYLEEIRERHRREAG